MAIYWFALLALPKPSDGPMSQPANGAGITGLKNAEKGVVMRARTNFKGWQDEIDFFAAEAERQKRVDRAIELHRRMREDEVRPLALKWQLTIIFCAFLFGSFVVWEVLTWAIDVVVQ